MGISNKICAIIQICFFQYIYSFHHSMLKCGNKNVLPIHTYTYENIKQRGKNNPTDRLKKNPLHWGNSFFNSQKKKSIIFIFYSIEHNDWDEWDSGKKTIESIQLKIYI